MRTVASFRSAAFNTSEPKPEFMNRGVIGEDLARWLIARLRSAGAETDDQPGQEDFGWYFNFAVPEGWHTCVIGLRPGSSGSPPDWVVWTERRRGFLSSIIGGRSRGISPFAVMLVHMTLSTAPEISELRWHERKAFDSGREDGAASEP